MRRSVVLVLLALVATALAGCGRLPSSGAAGGASASPSVSYEVRGEGGGLTKGITESGSFTVGKNTLELKGGHVFANRKDYGQVKAGDSVLLDKDGQLFVNGEKHSSR